MGQFVFKLPDVGEGTAEAEIVAWHVRVGDVVREDAPLVDVMTDKATVEMTAPVSGKIVAHPRRTRRHGRGRLAPIAVFETEAASESCTGARPQPSTSKTCAPRPPTGAVAEPKPRIKVPAGAMAPGKRRSQAASAARRKQCRPARASQRALKGTRRMRKPRPPCARARKNSASISPPVRGSGPDGRITHDDLDARAGAACAGARGAALVPRATASSRSR